MRIRRSLWRFLSSINQSIKVSTMKVKFYVAVVEIFSRFSNLYLKGLSAKIITIAHYLLFQSNSKSKSLPGQCVNCLIYQMCSKIFNFQNIPNFRKWINFHSIHKEYIIILKIYLFHGKVFFLSYVICRMCKM